MQTKGPQRPQTSKFLLKTKRVIQKALSPVLFDLLSETLQNPQKPVPWDSWDGEKKTGQSPPTVLVTS